MEPGEAARLLAQTQAHSRRSLDFRAPWVSLVAAAVALVGFGIVWLNVRNQHPFTGPSPVSLVVFYGLIALRIATVIYARARARAGVSGHSVKVQRDEAVVLGAQDGPLGKDLITADEVAAHAGTIAWEVMTSISRRVPRFYREP